MFEEFERSEYTIYKTNDYGMFKKMLGNRDAKSENKIVQSIKDIGYVCEPIVINEKMEVIDGQNRLAAYEQLGIPVHFVVQEGLTIESCRKLNWGQTNWGILDYIYSDAERGIKDYQFLASLVNEFEKPLGVQGILAMAKPNALNDGGGMSTSSVKDGRFTMTATEYELASTRINSALSLGYADFAKRNKLNARVFWACVSYIYQHNDVSAKSVIEALEQYESLIPSCTKVSEQLRFIDDAINRGVRRSTDKVFLSTDFQKRKYIERG